MAGSSPMVRSARLIPASFRLPASWTTSSMDFLYLPMSLFERRK